MRLPRMYLVAAWSAVAVLAALGIGRAIALADRRPDYVPQLDVPLRRGTDLPDEDCGYCNAVGGSEPGAWHRYSCPSYVPEPARRPEDEVGLLGGAILGLAFAVDDTTARYWLAQCARRGASQAQLDELWADWERQNVPTYLHTTLDPRTDDQR